MRVNGESADVVFELFYKRLKGLNSRSLRRERKRGLNPSTRSVSRHGKTPFLQSICNLPVDHKNKSCDDGRVRIQKNPGICELRTGTGL